jgi:hypothetical protein
MTMVKSLLSIVYSKFHFLSIRQKDKNKTNHFVCVFLMHLHHGALLPIFIVDYREPAGKVVCYRIPACILHHSLDPRGWKGRVETARNNFAHDGYIESTCCCVQARFLGIETKILFSLIWYIQRYVIKYLKL